MMYEARSLTGISFMMTPAVMAVSALAGADIPRDSRNADAAAVLATRENDRLCWNLKR